MHIIFYFLSDCNQLLLINTVVFVFIVTGTWESASEISFIVPGSCLEEWGQGEGKDGHSMKKSGSEPYIFYNIKSQPLFKISVLHFFG